jgi:peroxidase
VPFDAESPYALDTGYFANVLANRTLLESDAALAASPRTAGKVRQWKDNPGSFASSFAAAMVKMGSMRGTNPGKVRLNCTRVRI